MLPWKFSSKFIAWIMEPQQSFPWVNFNTIEAKLQLDFGKTECIKSLHGKNLQFKKLKLEKNLNFDEITMTAENEKSPLKLINRIRGGFSQMSVMLEAPHLKNAILVYTIQFCILFGWVGFLKNTWNLSFFFTCKLFSGFQLEHISIVDCATFRYNWRVWKRSSSIFHRWCFGYKFMHYDRIQSEQNALCNRQRGRKFRDSL